MNLRRCPVPFCKGPVPKHSFYCAKHYELVPQLFKDAITKSYRDMLRAPDADSRAVCKSTLRMALAFSYGVVCEKLGLPVPGKPVAPTSSVRQAIHGALNPHE